MARRKEIIVGVDMGGTSLRALVVNEENRILAVEKTPTKRDQDPENLIEDIAAEVEDAVESAGLRRNEAVDSSSGLVHAAPNLGWKDVRLGPKLSALLGVPVLVENDVNAGVVGEHALGAGRGVQELVGIFVGTGIGGGIISRGELYEGCRGAAGEIGHMVLEVDGPRCGCGKRGCAEALASRTAMEREVRAAIKEGAKSCVLDIMKERHKERMTSSIIVRALKNKDRVMRGVLRRTEYYLGILVASVVNLMDPECVVIGGGVAERLQEEFVGPIRKTARKYYLSQRDAARIKIVPAQLGDNAGALGAVVLARKRLHLAR
ncbi:MAG: ROK family protein [Acidobacteriia bacterium]|nr:ROK family protein [Terriglobia bacterium]